MKTSTTTNKAATNNAPAMSIAAEIATKKEAVKQAAQPKLTKIKPLYCTDKAAPYAALSKNKSIFRAYTIACLAHAGFIRINKAGVSSTGKKGNATALRTFVGATAYKLWGKTDKAGKITAELLNKANTCLDGAGTYGTTIDVVKAMHAAIEKGGKHKVPTKQGTELEFDFKFQFADKV